MRLRMSAASFSSTVATLACGASLSGATTPRYCAKAECAVESAKPKIRAKESRRDIAGILPEHRVQDNTSKRKRAQAEPARAFLRYVVAGLRWESVRTCGAPRQLPLPSP